MDEQIQSASPIEIPPVDASISSSNNKKSKKLVISVLCILGFFVGIAVLGYFNLGNIVSLPNQRSQSITPVPTVPVDWKTFTQDKEYYSFRYPAGVTVTSYGEAGARVTKRVSNEPCPTPGCPEEDPAHYRITFSGNLPFNNLKLFTESVRDYTASSFGKDRLSPIETYSLGNTQGLMYRINLVTQAQDIFLQREKNIVFFITVIYGSKGEQANNQSEVNALLSSLVFTKQSVGTNISQNDISKTGWRYKVKGYEDFHSIYGYSFTIPKNYGFSDEKIKAYFESCPEAVFLDQEDHMLTITASSNSFKAIDSDRKFLERDTEKNTSYSYEYMQVKGKKSLVQYIKSVNAHIMSVIVPVGDGTLFLNFAGRDIKIDDPDVVQILNSLKLPSELDLSCLYK